MEITGKTIKQGKSLYDDLSDTVKYQLDRMNSLDIYTSKHIHSVSVIVNRICRKLNLDEDYIKFCVTCAYLHDIGKIFIPPSILQNKGSLTEEQFEIMKKHTTYGFNFCFSIPALRQYALAAKSHHENNKGTGYPDRLKAEEIGLEIKIVKIADIYDALVSKRQYKEGFSKIKATNIIKEEVDKGMIDSKLFEVLLDIIIEDLEEEILNEENKDNIKQLEEEKIKIIEMKNK